MFPEEATATAAAKAETPNDEAVAIEPAPTEDAQVVAATSDEAKRDDAGPEAAVVIAKLASAAAAAAAASLLDWLQAMTPALTQVHLLEARCSSLPAAHIVS